MRKLILLAAFIFPLLAVSDCYAFKIFGIEITYKRGKPEWNADHTDTKCVGRGLCEFSVKGDVDAMTFTGQLGNVDGKLVLSIPASYYEKYADDFEGDVFSINDDIVVSAEDAAKIKFSGDIVVRPGIYKVVLDDESGNYFIYLQN